MRSRSHHASRLAESLTAHAGTRVRLVWSGGWNVQWSDGPTAQGMRRLVDDVDDLAGPFVPDRYARCASDLGIAVALLQHLAQCPEDALDARPHLAGYAFDRIEYPERSDLQTRRRAAALICPGLGTITLDTYANLRRSAATGGWNAITEWLDAHDPVPINRRL